MKKWLVVVTDEQYDWIKKTAAEVGVKGSVVVRGVMEKVKTIDSGDFKMSLLKEQLKDKLESIENEQKKLDDQKNEIMRKLKGRVTA